ncbi:MAG: hypothetical protein LBK29_02230 [Oscillospiraceae bacterium]|nr:hypothetical protein [Oscillospiraceae bacterium]
MLMFSVTFDLETDMEKVIGFFDDNEKIFSPYMIRYGRVAEFGTNYYDNQDLKNNILNNSFGKLYDKFYDALSDNKESNVTLALKSLYSTMYPLDYKQKFVGNDYKEICVPGSKMAVSPDENIYICEKVNQAYPIGTLDKGFCLEKINSLIGKFVNIINNNCATCNVSRLCDMCYAQMICDSDLCFSKTACESACLALKKSLISFYSLLEKNEKMVKKILNPKII